MSNVIHYTNGDLKYSIEEVHISRIEVGDTVLCKDGKIRTVCLSDIKKDQLLGKTLFGNCYALGLVKVQRLKIIHER